MNFVNFKSENHGSAKDRAWSHYRRWLSSSSAMLFHLITSFKTGPGDNDSRLQRIRAKKH